MRTRKDGPGPKDSAPSPVIPHDAAQHLPVCPRETESSCELLRSPRKASFLTWLPSEEKPVWDSGFQTISLDLKENLCHGGRFDGGGVMEVESWRRLAWPSCRADSVHYGMVLCLLHHTQSTRVPRSCTPEEPGLSTRSVVINRVITMQ